jgi:Na+/proline symporter
MSSGAIAILIALAVMLAIIVAIAAFYVRRYQDVSPEKQQEMNQTFRRYMSLAGVMFIALGVLSMTQDEPYLGNWWFGVGCAGLGALMLLAALIGIPSWGKRNNP